MHFTPHDYQRQAAAFLFDKPGAGLFMDPGLGKTASTLSAIRAFAAFEIKNRMLVIAPKSVALTVWQAEAAKWNQFSKFKIATLVGNEKQRIEALNSDADIFVINVESIAWLSDIMTKRLRKDIRKAIRETRSDNLEKRLERILELEDSRNWKNFFNVLAVDESTRFKSPDSTCFRRLKRVLDYFDRKYILTGTPVPNSLLDLWTQIYILDGGERLGRTMTEYKARFFRRGGYMDREFIPLDGAKEIIEQRIADIVFRLDANDWLDLPDLIINDVWVTLPRYTREIYQTFEAELFASLETCSELTEDNRRDEISTLSPAGKYLTCRQIANGGVYVDEDEIADPKVGKDRESLTVHSAKLDALESIVSELNGKPILVLYQFWHDLKQLESRFGKRPTINSDTKRNDFGRIVDSWNAGEIHLLFAQPQSMSHGLNLQEGPGRDVVFFGLTDSLDVYEQAYKRIYRQGVDSSVRVHRILARDTVDEVMRDRVDGKAEYQRSILDALKTLGNSR